jgi:gluconate 2-dehydrogenase gamma chain
MGNPSRRSFIGSVAALAGAASNVACNRHKSPWRFFRLEEARTLEAICGRIIPEDQDAGAIQASVVHFIDTQLTGFYKPLRKTYRQGISAIDQASVHYVGKQFADLPPDSQTALLERIEEDVGLKPFFNLLVEHCMQGFYGDPRHGGNRNRVSWKMLGVPYPPVRGRLRYDFTNPLKGERPWP